MSSSQGSNTNITSKINAFQAFAHLPRTMKVAAATMRDSRVSIVPKILFIGSIIFVLAALLTPEALAEFVAVIPGVGDVLAIAGLPVDGVIDWLALGITALNMMKLFPQHIVNEHFDEVVAKGKPTGAIVDADPVH
ncbi:MAG: hypothetical protein ACHQ1E_13665 [Ktedonobacterales bacterium]